MCATGFVLVPRCLERKARVPHNLVAAAVATLTGVLLLLLLGTGVSVAGAHRVELACAHGTVAAPAGARKLIVQAIEAHHCVFDVDVIVEPEREADVGAGPGNSTCDLSGVRGCGDVLLRSVLFFGSLTVRGCDAPRFPRAIWLQNVSVLGGALMIHDVVLGNNAAVPVPSPAAAAHRDDWGDSLAGRAMEGIVIDACAILLQVSLPLSIFDSQHLHRIVADYDGGLLSLQEVWAALELDVPLAHLVSRPPLQLRNVSFVDQSDAAVLIRGTKIDLAIAAPPSAADRSGVGGHSSPHTNTNTLEDISRFIGLIGHAMAAAASEGVENVSLPSTNGLSQLLRGGGSGSGPVLVSVRDIRFSGGGDAAAVEIEDSVARFLSVVWESLIIPRAGNGTEGMEGAQNGSLIDDPLTTLPPTPAAAAPALAPLSRSVLLVLDAILPRVASAFEIWNVTTASTLSVTVAGNTVVSRSSLGALMGQELFHDAVVLPALDVLRGLVNSTRTEVGAHPLDHTGAAALHSLLGAAGLLSAEAIAVTGIRVGRLDAADFVRVLIEGNRVRWELWDCAGGHADAPRQWQSEGGDADRDAAPVSVLLPLCLSDAMRVDTVAQAVAESFLPPPTRCALHGANRSAACLLSATKFWETVEEAVSRTAATAVDRTFTPNLFPRAAAVAVLNVTAGSSGRVVVIIDRNRVEAGAHCGLAAGIAGIVTAGVSGASAISLRHNDVAVHEPAAAAAAAAAVAVAQSSQFCSRRAAHIAAAMFGILLTDISGSEWGNGGSVNVDLAFNNVSLSGRGTAEVAFAAGAPPCALPLFSVTSLLHVSRIAARDDRNVSFLLRRSTLSLSMRLGPGAASNRVFISHGLAFHSLGDVAVLHLTDSLVSMLVEEDVDYDEVLGHARSNTVSAVSIQAISLHDVRVRAALSDAVQSSLCSRGLVMMNLSASANASLRAGHFPRAALRATVVGLAARGNSSRWTAVFAENTSAVLFFIGNSNICARLVLLAPSAPGELPPPSHAEVSVLGGFIENTTTIASSLSPEVNITNAAPAAPSANFPSAIASIFNTTVVAEVCGYTSSNPVFTWGTLSVRLRALSLRAALSFLGDRLPTRGTVSLRLLDVTLAASMRAIAVQANLTAALAQHRESTTCSLTSNRTALLACVIEALEKTTSVVAMGGHTDLRPLDVSAGALEVGAGDERESGGSSVHNVSAAGCSFLLVDELEMLFALSNSVEVTSLDRQNIAQLQEVDLERETLRLPARLVDVALGAVVSVVPSLEGKGEYTHPELWAMLLSPRDAREVLRGVNTLVFTTLSWSSSTTAAPSFIVKLRLAATLDPEWSRFALLVDSLLIMEHRGALGEGTLPPPANCSNGLAAAVLLDVVPRTVPRTPWPPPPVALLLRRVVAARSPCHFPSLTPPTTPRSTCGPREWPLLSLSTACWRISSNSLLAHTLSMYADAARAPVLDRRRDLAAVVRGDLLDTALLTPMDGEIPPEHTGFATLTHVLQHSGADLRIPAPSHRLLSERALRSYLFGASRGLPSELCFRSADIEMRLPYGAPSLRWCGTPTQSSSQSRSQSAQTSSFSTSVRLERSSSSSTSSSISRSSTAPRGRRTATPSPSPLTRSATIAVSVTTTDSASTTQSDSKSIALPALFPRILLSAPVDERAELNAEQEPMTGSRPEDYNLTSVSSTSLGDQATTPPLTPVIAMLHQVRAITIDTSAMARHGSFVVTLRVSDAAFNCNAHGLENASALLGAAQLRRIGVSGDGRGEAEAGLSALTPERVTALLRQALRDGPSDGSGDSSQQRHPPSPAATSSDLEAGLMRIPFFQCDAHVARIFDVAAVTSAFVDVSERVSGAPRSTVRSLHYNCSRDFVSLRLPLVSRAHTFLTLPRAGACRMCLFGGDFLSQTRDATIVASGPSRALHHFPASFARVIAFEFQPHTTGTSAKQTALQEISWRVHEQAMAVATVVIAVGAVLLRNPTYPLALARLWPVAVITATAQKVSPEEQLLLAQSSVRPPWWLVPFQRRIFGDSEGSSPSAAADIRGALGTVTSNVVLNLAIFLWMLPLLHFALASIHFLATSHFLFMGKGFRASRVTSYRTLRFPSLIPLLLAIAGPPTAHLTAVLLQALADGFATDARVRGSDVALYVFVSIAAGLTILGGVVGVAVVALWAPLHAECRFVPEEPTDSCSRLRRAVHGPLEWFDAETGDSRGDSGGGGFVRRFEGFFAHFRPPLTLLAASDLLIACVCAGIAGLRPSCDSANGSCPARAIACAALCGAWTLLVASTRALCTTWDNGIAALSGAAATTGFALAAAAAAKGDDGRGAARESAGAMVAVLGVLLVTFGCVTAVASHLVRFLEQHFPALRTRSRASTDDEDDDERDAHELSLPLLQIRTLTPSLPTSICPKSRSALLFDSDENEDNGSMIQTPHLVNPVLEHLHEIRRAQQQQQQRAVGRRCLPRNPAVASAPSVTGEINIDSVSVDELSASLDHNSELDITAPAPGANPVLQHLRTAASAQIDWDEPEDLVFNHEENGPAHRQRAGAAFCE